MVFGLGIDQWDPLTLADVIPAHFPHSEYLLLLFSGGYVALLLFLAFIWSSLVHPHADPEGVIARLLLVTTFLALGLTEVSWNPLTVDGLSWTVLALVAVGVSSGAANGSGDPLPGMPAHGRPPSSVLRTSGGAPAGSGRPPGPATTPPPARGARSPTRRPVHGDPASSRAAARRVGLPAGSSGTARGPRYDPRLPLIHIVR